MVFCAWCAAPMRMGVVTPGGVEYHLPFWRAREALIRLGNTDKTAPADDVPVPRTNAKRRGTPAAMNDKQLLRLILSTYITATRLSSVFCAASDGLPMARSNAGTRRKPGDSSVRRLT